MSSALTMRHPCLPPTTNFLDSQQRARLVRSTRKLGAVLGTTPCLLENDTSFALLPLGKTTSKLLKHPGALFMHHQTSSLSLASSSTSPISSHRPSPSASSVTLPRSTSSTESLPLDPPGLSATRKQRVGDKAPKLYLRLDTAPVSPSNDRVLSSLPPSPCTPCPPTPITPIIPDVTEVRRKRMAKLARHLGENIPAELVLPESAPKPPTDSPDRCARKRSQSVRFTSAELACLSGDKPPLGRPRPDWVGEWNRSNIEDVQKELRNLRAK